MPRRARLIAFVLVALPVTLWVLALLFRFRVVNIFDAYLMKFPGPVVVFGAMVFCPLAALLLGIRMARRARERLLGVVTALTGGFLLMAFAVLIGIPMVEEALGPRTPLNPGTPRPVEQHKGIPVFPGAEGFGTRTPAGRGGKVIEVTSLADHGGGTLRAALADPSPRVIVFRKGGTISLESELQIQHPFVTLAGQTAPGGGICIRNAGIAIFSHDVLIQHIRVRPGNEGEVDADVNDAIQILGGQGDANGAYNVVLDHVSVSWGEDETISTWYGAHDVTISWCIISEALDRSRHRKGTHSAGLLIGDGSWHVTVHHSLLAHNDFRNPLIQGGGTHDFVNNVVYDWGILPTEIVDTHSNSFLNFVGNLYRRGPSTKEQFREILINPTEGTPKIHSAGNVGPYRQDEAAPGWDSVGYGWDGSRSAPERYRAAKRFTAAPVMSTSAKEAYPAVLERSGATRPERDTVDRRIVEEVRKETGRIPDSPEEVGGYPDLRSGEPPTDTDHDGMPDEWEMRHGLDPQEHRDSSGDLDKDGYTNIEEYLHSLH